VRYPTVPPAPEAVRLGSHARPGKHLALNGFYDDSHDESLRRMSGDFALPRDAGKF